MDLSIIIVSWNVKDKLRECLKSIQETVGALTNTECFWDDTATQHSVLPLGVLPLEYEVFVADNDSKDGSAEMVVKEFPEFFVIPNRENLGFAKANNQGIKLSQGRYVLLLNPDMRLLPGTLEKMVRFMDDPQNAKVGVAGCHLVSPVVHNPSQPPLILRGGEDFETVPQVRKFPMLKDQLAIMLKLPHFFPKIVDKYMMPDFDYSKEARVESIRGSFFMIRREVLDKIGLLDEGFFIWFEEVDFCKRVTEAGYTVAYTPIAKCVDYVGQSFKQIKFYPKQKMFTESMLYYFKKHRPWWEYEVLDWLRPVVLVMTWAGDLVRSRISR